MFYLIYVSSAIKLMDDQELLFLLKQSRDNNLRLGITGMLLYKEGNFMQMIEGEKQTVLDLYETIRKDTRHRELITIITDETDQRAFDDWSMGFRNMDKAGPLPKFHEYIEANLTLRSFEGNAVKAHQFMVFFNEANR